jgi:hypothetical protein
MAIVGLKMATIALYGTDGKILTGTDGLSTTGLFDLDDAVLGSTQANITNVEGSVVKVSGNNKLQDAYTQPAAPQIALTVNNLPLPIRNKILGNTSDGKGGYVFSGTKPRVGLLITSESLDRSTRIYFGFANTKATMASQNIQSDTDTTINREPDALTFEALGVDEWNGQPIKNWVSSDTGFAIDTMKAEVFNGYTASTTTGTTGS